MASFEEQVERQAHRELQEAVEEALTRYVDAISSIPGEHGDVTDWGIAYTMSRVDEDNEPLWGNRMVSKMYQNPNTHVHLFQWASDILAAGMLEEEDDDE